MGNDQASCLASNIIGKEKEIYKENKSVYRKPSSSYTNSSNKNYLTNNSNNLINSYQSFGQINTSSKKYTKINPHSNNKDIDKIIIIQKFVRFALSIKKFNERIELLSNIIELDNPVNLIKDKYTENEILSNNKGEILSEELLKNKKIIPFEETLYYRKNIKYYRPNRYLRYTSLIYIDKYKNNNLYKGTWTLEKIFHGYGIFYVSGNKYEGFWNFGKLSGECRYFLQNNDYFIGNFEEGQAKGYGKYFHNDGTIYEGEWLNDQPSGKGKEIFVDGSFFDGIFENGIKKKGLFKWNDGSYYDGEIKNNVFDGIGKFHWKEGKEYIGAWEGGKMSGEGVMKYIDGSRYEGNFVNGKREGFGKYTWNNRKYYEGGWKKGKQDGKGYFYNKGKGIQAIWKDGKITNYLNLNNNKLEPNNSDYNGRILHTNGYNDSIISVNQSSISGIENIFFRMKTTQNRYKNINYKLNDITKRKTNDIRNNNRFSNKYTYFSSKGKTTDKKNKKNVSQSIKKGNKNLSRISLNSNNSFVTTKEGRSMKRNSEIKQLNQTQDNTPSNNKKIFGKKK